MATLLEGLQVLELGDGVAGACAAAALAELGASVTKLTAAGDGRAQVAGQLDLDRFKTVTGDRSAVAGGEWHVVIDDRIDSGTPSQAPALLGRSPRVLVTITAFGLDGTHDGWVGSEFVALAAGGGMAGVHDAEGRPVPTAGWQAMLSTGAVAALAALDGLNTSREQSDAPVEVDVAARDAVVFTFTYLDCAHHLLNCPGSSGGRRYTAPTGIFPTRDGHLRLAAVDDHQWNGAKAAFGNPEWAEKYRTVEDRRDHAQRLTAEVRQWTLGRAKAEVAQLLQEHGVPATPVNNGPEVMAAPHLWERGFFRAEGDAVVHGSAFGLAGPAGSPSGATPTPDSRGHWDREDRPTLSELFLVEATHVISAPIAGSLLGAMGTRVLRLEDVDRIDMYRRIGPWVDGEPGVEQGAYFLTANMNKQSLAFSVADLAPVAEVLDGADLVLENVRAARLRRWRIDLDALNRDDKLTVSVSGFGRTGPLADYRAYANNIHAYAGLTDATRTPTGEYAEIFTVLADICTSLATALVMSAWALGPRSGTATDADIAMLDVMVARLLDVLTGPGADGQSRATWSRREPGAAPNDILPVGDGDFIAVTIRDDREWSVLAEHLGIDARWAGREAREADPDGLHDELVERLRSHKAVDLETYLQANGIAAARVVGPEQTCHDPVLRARGLFRVVEHAERGQYVALCQPWRLPEHGRQRWRGAPVLGDWNLAAGRAVPSLPGPGR
ncbi:CoA transferase [Luedemannella helvata]|uniref:CoA transferase n=1 Tax=Luedemannella helvata TaxID=349315 RepID=A0ABN2JTP5_9ACTN